MMIETNIRNLSRAELLYTCVAKLAIFLHKNGKDNLLSGLEHYYAANDFNKTFYYSDSSETNSRIESILKDADRLLEACGQSYDEVKEYQLPGKGGESPPGICCQCGGVCRKEWFRHHRLSAGAE